MFNGTWIDHRHCAIKSAQKLRAVDDQTPPNRIGPEPALVVGKKQSTAATGVNKPINNFADRLVDSFVASILRQQPRHAPKAPAQSSRESGVLILRSLSGT